MHLRSLFFLAAAALAGAASFAQQNVKIDDRLFHIGRNVVAGFRGHTNPVGTRIDLPFKSELNVGEWTLKLTQRDVHTAWPIELNGKKIGALQVRGAQVTAHYAVAAEALKEGDNVLTFAQVDGRDDILVGEFELIPRPMRDVLGLARLMVRVTDDRKQAIPARITIANATNKLADIYNVAPATAAWREGIIYTGAGGVAEFDVPEGVWTISANRGMEWSRARAVTRTFVGQKRTIDLSITREVDTTGFVCVDTHLHTYELSGHGDASLDERISSLAGEGVEMAIATDHNHNTDYAPRQRELQLAPWFTPVVGNEVTTKNGHFNAFPFKVGDPKPNQNETNWVKLVEDIRMKGAKFVVLNHPRWPNLGTGPFGVFGLNRAEGSRATGSEFTFDAMEVLNSTFPLKQAEYMLVDWFALLNRGERIWGAGASDTHTVYDVAGQGRTYFRSATDDPARIDVDEAIKALKAGDSTISFGIFSDVLVNNAANMGETITPANKSLHVNFRVAAPSWVRVRKAVVYLNGLEVAQSELPALTNKALNTNFVFTIPAPAHDAHLICAAFGDGVKDAAWTTIADFTMAATNPIFVDADGDGKYQPLRATAKARIDEVKPLNLAGVEKIVRAADAALGVQLLAEARLRLPASDLESWSKLVDDLEEKHALYKLYKTHLPKPAAKKE